MRPVSPEDFDSPDGLRAFLIEEVDRTRRSLQEGRIVEFSPETWDPEALMTTISTGSLGGKARGLAFASTILAMGDLEAAFPEVTFSIPRFAVIGTDEFDRFMESNALLEPALDADSDEGTDRLFFGADLDQGLVDRLRFYPTFSGLVQSTNYYPISYQQREEGVAYLALGLGMTVVENERSLRFSPHHPQILPQFFSPESTL